MPENDDRVTLLDELIGAQLERVPCPDCRLKDVDRGLLSLMASRPGQVRLVTLPDEVVGPQIERPFEITFG